MAGVDADEGMLVHDAARPCLPRQDFLNLIKETQMDQIGGILALPVTETVKKVAKDETGAQRIAGTEDRSQLWLGPTPPTVRASPLAQARPPAQGDGTRESNESDAKRPHHAPL